MCCFCSEETYSLVKLLLTAPSIAFCNTVCYSKQRRDIVSKLPTTGFVALYSNVDISKLDTCSGIEFKTLEIGRHSST